MLQNRAAIEIYKRGDTVMCSRYTSKFCIQLNGQIILFLAGSDVTNRNLPRGAINKLYFQRAQLLEGYFQTQFKTMNFKLINKVC